MLTGAWVWRGRCDQELKGGPSLMSHLFVLISESSPV